MQIMEEQLRKRRTQTTTELPQEIIHNEILPRLPHKSVIRCRCVSKSWLSQISDPEFVKLHLSHHQYRCVCKSGLSQISDPEFVKVHLSHYQCCDTYLLKRHIKPELEIVSPMKETSIDTAPFLGISLLIGSLNGLICFVRQEGFTLWNPAIRQYKELGTAQLHTSICKQVVDSCNWRCINGKSKHLYGFGWDRGRDDYKIVVVCYVQPDSKHAFVYSAISDSWTEVVLPTGIFGTNSRSYINSPVPRVVVNECPYWTYSKYLQLPGKSSKRRLTVVFKFVAENNEFRLLPEFDFAEQRELKLVNLRDRLVGMNYIYNGYRPKVLNIYSLDHEGSTGVWSKIYTTEAVDCGFLNTRVGLGRFTYTPSLVFIQGMKKIMHSETHSQTDDNPGNLVPNPVPTSAIQKAP